MAFLCDKIKNSKVCNIFIRKYLFLLFKILSGSFFVYELHIFKVSPLNALFLFSSSVSLVFSSLLSFICSVFSGKYWRSVQRYSPRLGLSLLEAKRGDSEEAEAVSAMASLSVANSNAMDQR